MTHSETLKPCPFCGSDNIKLTPSLMATDNVECRKCWAQGPIVHSDINNKDINQKKAINAWNTRK